MFVNAFGRFGVGLFLATLVSGCSSVDKRDSDDVGVLDRSNPCLLAPGSCIYEGRYEAGETDYAEQEARRLNEAESLRIRRRSRWW